jgi:hypothetical protein
MYVLVDVCFVVTNSISPNAGRTVTYSCLPAYSVHTVRIVYQFRMCESLSYSPSHTTLRVTVCLLWLPVAHPPLIPPLLISISYSILLGNIDYALNLS